MSLKKNNFYQKYFSELALSLARINKFITKENPSVGCVVTDFNNNILSFGVTSKNGRPHAENNALIKLNKKIKKKIIIFAILFVFQQLHFSEPWKEKVIAS